jgi:hypothetical protein
MSKEMKVQENELVESFSPTLLSVLTGISEHKLEVRDRWSIAINSCMMSVAKTVTLFISSRIRSSATNRFQSLVHDIFRREEYIDTIRNDLYLQDVFLLGYCHAMDTIISLTEDDIKLNNDSTINSVLKTYKLVAPTLSVLEQSFEINHSELSTLLSVSPSALTNFMNKVGKYNLFDSRQVGRNRYYTIASPNGIRALKIAKSINRPSIDSYSQFLSTLLETLYEVGQNDGLKEDYVFERCGALLQQYSTTPAKCREQIKALTSLLTAERIPMSILMKYYERNARKVIIFTCEIEAEKHALETIRFNLRRGASYQWFVMTEEKTNSIDEIHNQFLSLDEDGKYRDYLSDKIASSELQFSLISKSDKDRLLGDFEDVVIFDKKRAFMCKDPTIDNNSNYIAMPSNDMNQLIDYASPTCTA